MSDYKLVPVEPTEEMQTAFTVAENRYWFDLPDGEPHAYAEAFKQEYAAMLAAAPPPNGAVDNARLEAAFWDFDARRNGYGKWRETPQSERVAFKAAVLTLLQSWA